MKRFVFSILAVAFLIGIQADSNAQDVKSVIAEGVSAATDDGRAYDEALKNAQRLAVEQAAGVIISSQSVTKNYKLLSDKIFSRSKGYIKTWNLIKKGRDDEFYKVKIEADVLLSQLNSDLDAIKHLIAVTGGQRVIVIGVEKVNGVVKDTSYIQSPLEEGLLDKGFDLVSLEQSEKIKARDVALNFDDYSKAAALAKKHDAEIIVSYKAEANNAGSETLHGMTFQRFDVPITVKVIKASNGALLKSISEIETHAHPSGTQAAFKAMGKAAKKTIPKVLNGILDTLKKEFDEEGSQLELIIKNCSFRNANKIKKALAQFRGVNSISSPKLQNSVATLRLKANLDGNGLAEKLDDYAVKNDLKMEVTGVEQNRVMADWDPDQ